MKSTSVSEAKARWSEWIRRVARGEPILILSRGRPVARLVPIRAGERETADARVTRLERSGVLTHPPKPADWSFLDALLPRARGKRGVLDALREERDERR